jgi:hypothetical protein
LYNPSVTGTVTSAPPGFVALFESIVATTITQTTSGRTVTTTSSSTSGTGGVFYAHNTILPQVVEGEDGIDTNIILVILVETLYLRTQAEIRNLPILWAIKWIIPGFPKLPRFHIPVCFPCVRSLMNCR